MRREEGRKKEESEGRKGRVQKEKDKWFDEMFENRTNGRSDEEVEGGKEG